MIFLLAAAAAVLPIMSDTRQAELRTVLAQCPVSFQQDAIRCFEDALTRSEKRVLLATEYRRIGRLDIARIAAADWMDDAAFPKTAPASPLAREMASFRTVRDAYNARISFYDIVIRSYWLGNHGCYLDMEGRAEAMETSFRQRSESERIDALYPEIHVTYWTDPETDGDGLFRPSCVLTEGGVR